jgi:hypothetical protein
VLFEYTYTYELPPAPVLPKEPWRAGMYGDITVLLPVCLVKEWAAPSELRENLRRERDYLDLLKRDIKEQGITDPFIAVLDQMGRVTLMDGHHRLQVAEELGETLVPIRFTPSERIRKHCVPIADILPMMLQGRYSR